MCCKRRYLSRRAALMAHRRAGYRVRAYNSCPDCAGYWHVTNSDKNGPPMYTSRPGRRRRRKRAVAEQLAPVLSLEELQEIARRKREPYR